MQQYLIFVEASFFVIPAPFCNGVNSSRNPGFPVETGIYCFQMVPCFRRDIVWTPAGVYPDENRGRSDGFGTFYKIIMLIEIILKILIRQGPIIINGRFYICRSPNS
jgi:hypothetical protein